MLIAQGQEAGTHNSGGIVRPGQAIPTHYSGITFRSRLEADTAMFLDRLGISGWEYEASSFLLPESGEHYCPDFWVPGRRLWVEDRGYRNKRGDLQISEFADWIHNGAPEPDLDHSGRPLDFLVIGPDVPVLHENTNRFGMDATPAMLAHCAECAGYYFMGESGDYTCRACGASDGDHHVKDRWHLELHKGAIMIDSLPMWDWLDEHEFPVIRG